MKIRIIYVLVTCVLTLPVFASAATLRVSPPSASVSLGGVVSVSIQVSSANQAMNAASGVLRFPADSLQVTSISKSGSVIGLWVQEPSYSNVAGTVDFEGVVLNPGYTGNNGTVLTVTFRTLRVASAPLSISSGSVLANDGNGTEILTGVSGSTVTVSEAASRPPTPAPAPQPAPVQTGPTNEPVAATTSEPETSVVTLAPERTLYVIDQQSIILFLAVALAFLLGMAYVWFFHARNRPDKTVREVLRDVDVEVHKAFLTLRDSINNSLEEMEKESAARELTAAEKRFVREMTATIKETEKIVSADIKSAGK